MNNIKSIWSIINLTPEKNATRSVGLDILRILGYEIDSVPKWKQIALDADVTENIIPSVYPQPYSEVDQRGFLQLFDWNMFVFMFIRNPFDRFVSSYMHVNRDIMDGSNILPEYIDKDVIKFDLPIIKENQLKCFKDFCFLIVDGWKDLQSKGELFNHNPHIIKQTEVINAYVWGLWCNSQCEELEGYDIREYIRDGKVNLYKIENYVEEFKRLKLDLEKKGIKIFELPLQPQKIGDTSKYKFSTDYRDWYDKETIDVVTLMFQDELEMFDYEF